MKYNYFKIISYLLYMCTSALYTSSNHSTKNKKKKHNEISAVYTYALYPRLHQYPELSDAQTNY